MRVKFALVALASAVISTGAFAQASQAGPKGGMSSPNAQGVQIQGNTNIKASQKNATAVAVGKNNTAANEAGVIGGK